MRFRIVTMIGIWLILPTAAAAITIDFESPPTSGNIFGMPQARYCDSVCFDHGVRGSRAGFTQSTAYVGGNGMCADCSTNFIDISFPLPAANIEFTLYNWTG